MPLYIAQSGDLDRCYRCLTDSLTHSLTTLKDSATQLLIKYKSGALVTQLIPIFNNRFFFKTRLTPGRPSWWKWRTWWRSRRRRGTSSRRGRRRSLRWESDQNQTNNTILWKFKIFQIKKKPEITAEEKAKMEKRWATRRGSLPGASFLLWRRQTQRYI